MNVPVIRVVKASFSSICTEPSMAEYWQVGPVGVVSRNWLELYRRWCKAQFLVFDPAQFVNIMRPGPWGNPYVIGVDGDRDEVLRKYSSSVLSEAGFREQVESALRGKTLVCCCAPEPCHGIYLARVANRL